MNRSRQNGVALVITLIMLSVVTFMAVTFLALSRRERNAVAVASSQTTASMMSDMALARVQGEIAGRMLDRRALISVVGTNAISNLFSTDLMVSTNFIDPNGFDPAAVYGATNVNYDFVKDSHVPLTAEQRNANIARLQYDPRPPVYILTNTFGKLDARFYLDLNRNGTFETNGWQPTLDNFGNFLRISNNIVSNYFVGDPEWVGVLQNPSQPHSPSNLFVGRWAYIVLPSGKSLDINFMHNHARLAPNGQAVQFTADNFYRNQGVGTWELNLAGFLRDLNTNQWTVYNTNLIAPRTDLAHIDANNLLLYRYNNDLSFLPGMMPYFANLGYTTNAVTRALENDYIDSFGSGTRMSTVFGLKKDPDTTLINQNLPWPGSDNTNVYYDIQQLLDNTKFGNATVARLLGTNNLGTSRSSQDRYTFYRMLSQLGVDSASTLPGKMNINYVNDDQGLATNFVSWTPLGFFTNAAARLLSTQPELKHYVTPSFVYDYPALSVTNIPVYPVNYYTPAVHRLLQLAANMYDATTNRALVATTNYPSLPSVFRPVFRRTNENVYIAGYVEETTTNFLNFHWIDLNSPSSVNGRAALANKSSDPITNIMAYGIPLIIGAKKGLPNFNEYAMQTAVQVTRKLDFRKKTPQSAPFQTNQLFVVGISNTFGLEAWNSYTQAYPRKLQMAVFVHYDVGLTNLTNNQAVGIVSQLNPLHYDFPVFSTNITAYQWAGKQFLVPFNNSSTYLADMAFIPKQNEFLSLSNGTPFDLNPTFETPNLRLSLRARVRYWLIDMDVTPNRVVDFVNLANLGSDIDFSKQLIGYTNSMDKTGVEGSFWQTNNNSRTGIPNGVRQQLNVSLDESTNSSSVWMSISGDPMQGDTKKKAIDLFRVFLGLQPKEGYLYYQMQQELGNSLEHQAPFSPARKLFQNSKWQVNDPLVHYMVEDLVDWAQTNDMQFVVPITKPATNSNLGALNKRYSPWGGNPNKSADKYALDMSVKDPMVTQSDDWAFPTNKFPNIGWLGRVHRGTPWQTVYLKSAVVNTQDWAVMAGPAKMAQVTSNDFPLLVPTSDLASYPSGYQPMGNYYTHPTNDWRILDLFTTAINDNAARGRLSVNQANIAAWSAVLSGVSVLTNSFPDTWNGSRGHPSTNYSEIFVTPNSPQLHAILDSINQTRLQKPGQMYRYLGEVLSAPALTINSPFLSLTNIAKDHINISDEVVERIPQQILSLIKSDEPRVTVYTYGQTLTPAPNSRLLSGPSRGLCTNYMVVGEVVAKHVLRVDGTVDHPVVVRERFQYLPND